MPCQGYVFSNDALCDIYISLFTKRWGDTLSCYSRDALSDVLGALRHLVFGYVLLMNGQPCAYDLVFKAECPQWIFFDCINGGYDPDFASLSVGSVPAKTAGTNLQATLTLNGASATPATYSINAGAVAAGNSAISCI
ncbi:antimicrobial resistance protein Mig-14 [Serratia odorifera]|uniref:antimicrobial resistance protein Mig-14 n=1 Tax=Serratia odorifera TaxID=618 RepID=UPI002175367B|nr:antimicrobial resistance protein Mig-14 [Serratia odorifera]